jgi:hypothetical protein
MMIIKHRYVLATKKLKHGSHAYSWVWQRTAFESSPRFNVYHDTLAVFTRKVCTKYSADQLLADMNIKGYVEIPT